MSAGPSARGLGPPPTRPKRAGRDRLGFDHAWLDRRDPFDQPRKTRLPGLGAAPGLGQRGPGSCRSHSRASASTSGASRREQWRGVGRPPDGRVTVYGMKASGNCYKLQLLLGQLARPYRWVEVKVRRARRARPNTWRAIRTAKCAAGARDGAAAESRTRSCATSPRAAALPCRCWLRAQALQWLFFRPYSHEPYVAWRVSFPAGCRPIIAQPSCRGCASAGTRHWR